MGVDVLRWGPRASTPVEGGLRRPRWVRLPPTPAKQEFRYRTCCLLVWKNGSGVDY